MECFKMYCILINVLIVAIKVSEAVDIQFERQEPNIVQVGDNVTFHWRYNGGKTVEIVKLYIEMGGSNDEIMVNYAIRLPNPKPVSFKAAENYAATIKWAGNVSKNEYAFTLVNVSESSHQKSFYLKFDYTDLSEEIKSTKDPLFISVLPNVQLRVDKTNVSVGDRVTLECHIVKSGRPTATILWYHNNTLLKGKTAKYLFRDSEVEKKDAGSYRCSGKNNAGEDRSEVIKIAVHGKQDGKHDKKDNPSARDSSGGLGGGEIAGLVFGILIVVIFIIVLVFVLRRQKNKPKRDERTTVNNDESKSAMVPEAEEKDQVWL